MTNIEISFTPLGRNCGFLWDETMKMAENHEKVFRHFRCFVPFLRIFVL